MIVMYGYKAEARQIFMFSYSSANVEQSILFQRRNLTEQSQDWIFRILSSMATCCRQR